MKFTSLVLSSAIVSSLLLSGCNKGGGQVGSINNDPISLEEFQEYLLTKPSVKVNFQGQVVDLPASDTLGYQALEELVTQKAITQIAESEKVTPTDADVKSEIEFRKKLNPRFLVDLSAIGLSAPQIEKQVKIELTRERLLTKGVNLTIADVNEYIQKNPKEFIEPAMAELRWIFISDQSKKSIVDQELKGGQKFDIIASKFSQYPNARKDQGRFPQRVIKNMPVPIQQFLNKSEAGQTSDWIQVGNGAARFYIDNKTPERAMKMDENRKEMLRRDLSLRKGALSNDIGKKILEKLKSSKIDITYPAMQGVWKRYEERLKEVSDRATANQKEAGK